MKTRLVLLPFALLTLGLAHPAAASVVAPGAASPRVRDGAARFDAALGGALAARGN